MSGTILEAVFSDLKKIMKKYEKELRLIADTHDSYSLTGPYSEKYKKDLWFGSVQIKKNFVSYHFMPVYMYPELLKELSPALKKRMQGKACFNFKKQDESLFNELAVFTEKGFKRFQRGDFL
jgi:hypothetical protein